MDPRRAPRLLACVALAVPLSACSVFDPDLYKGAVLDMADGADMVGVDSGGADMSKSVPELALADRCVSDVPMLTTSPQEFVVDTTHLGNDFSDLSACTGYEEPGNDGFFAINAQKGQRWHFHIKPLTPGTNISLYVVPTCDDRGCTLPDSQDECGADRDEHLSFIAPTAGKYMVGIDMRTSGGGRFDVLAVRPVCGDSAQDHSESCDDGNTTPGDGCDDRCRVELSPSRLNELEPNDDFTGANVVMLNATTPSLTVRARLGGRCDFDTFAVNVPMGGSIRATLLDPSGAACATTTPAMSLTLLLPDGHTKAGQVAGSDGAGCAAIGVDQPFANNIQTAGTYYVRVATNKDVATAFDYSIKLELK
jgi:cysteine-rich repeat protein